jgi:hypothetical protein
VFPGSSPTIPEDDETGETKVAKEQKITPFDVEGAVDEQGRDVGMYAGKGFRPV